MAGEDGGHLFFKCKVAKSIWRILGLENERQVLAAIHSAVEATECILKVAEEKKLTMVTALWYIWNERNTIREEGKRCCPLIIARRIETYVKEMSTPDHTIQQEFRSRTRDERWLKPPTNILKLNCDAAFDHNTKEGGWGALIKDGDGDVVITGRGRISHVLSPFHAEMIACLQGIQMATDLGVGQLIVELDAQEAVKAINSNAYDDSVVGHLVLEVKELVASNFISCVGVFAGRSCNRAAHQLAAMGRECVVGEEVITTVLPDDVSVCVANDLLAE